MLQPFAAELIRDYVMSVYKLKGEPESASILIWKNVVLTTIDFLVSVENFGFLFIEMKKWFEDHKLVTLFLESLEAFILRNRVKYIPNEPFREVVNFYTEKKKVDVLQYLIINLSLEDMDIDFAISVCMEFNLLSALMYLCSHKENETPDFLSPIARALSLYRNSSYEAVGDKLVEAYSYGLKFLWFVSMTLKGKMWPFGVIPEDIWREKVKDIITLIFEENNLLLML